MKDTRSIVVLSILTVTLVGGLCVGIIFNPMLAVGLPAVLLAIAAIIRAIVGTTPTGPDDEEDTGSQSSPR